MKLKIILLASVISSFINYVYSQNTQIIYDVNENKIEINLYRGIVALRSCECDQLKIIHETYDYDEYKAGNKVSIHEPNRSNLVVERANNKINIENSRSRNIQHLTLSIPSNMNVKININHFGEITLDGDLGKIDAQLFQGKIKGTAKKSVSAAIIRDGIIEFDIVSNDFGLGFFSIWDGDISLNLINDLNSRLDIQMDLGELINEIDAVLEVKEEFGGTIKNGSETSEYNTKTFKGFINNEKDNTIIIKNSLGDIKLKTND